MHTDRVIKTGVDDLIELLKKKEKLSFQEISQALGISIEVIQNWVEFLVEEEVVSIEYKLITPYVSLIKKNQKETLLDTYEEFVKKARLRNISEDMITVLWKKYVIEHKATIRDVFMRKAMMRGLDKRQIDTLWDQYYARLVEENGN